MISFTWADNVQKDDALRPGEFASARASTPSERQLAGAARGKTCNTFLLRGCHSVMRLIVTNDQPQPGLFKRLRMERLLRKTVAARGPDVPDAFASSVYATVLALVPEAITDLRKQRHANICGSCTCVFKSGGPLDNNSPVAAFARSETIEYKALKEARSHGA